MKSLLKSDLFRARKDKVLWIGLFVTIGLVLFQVILSKILVSTMSSENEGIISSNLASTGLALWSNGVSINGNTAQLLVPVFVTIFIVKEFSDRTIRNKLIVGYSRSQIYFSIIIVHIIVSLVYLFAASITGLIFGSLFFGFGVDFSADAVGVLLIGFILQFILSYMLIGFAIVFAINKQSLILGIIIPLVVVFIFSIIYMVAVLGVSEGFTKAISFTNFYQTNEIQNMTSLNDLTVSNWVTVYDNSGAVKDIFELPLTPLARILITAPIVISLELVIGFLRFKKIQFK